MFRGVDDSVYAINMSEYIWGLVGLVLEDLSARIEKLGRNFLVRR